MEVRRVTNQSGGSLREFYANCVGDPSSRRAEIGLRMLAFLDRLAMTDGPPLWGMTSHLALHLFINPGEAGGACVHGHEPGYFVVSSGPGNPTSWAADAGGAVALVMAELGLPYISASSSPPDA